MKHIILASQFPLVILTFLTTTTTTTTSADINEREIFRNPIVILDHNHHSQTASSSSKPPPITTTTTTQPIPQRSFSSTSKSELTYHNDIKILQTSANNINNNLNKEDYDKKRKNVDIIPDSILIQDENLNSNKQKVDQHSKTKRIITTIRSQNDKLGRKIISTETLKPLIAIDDDNNSTQESPINQTTTSSTLINESFDESLMPTDSTEDQLDSISSTMTTSELNLEKLRKNVNPQNSYHNTQYTISLTPSNQDEELSLLLSSSAPLSNDKNNNNKNDSSEPDDEQKLVESNNVSAILSASEFNKRNRALDFKQKQRQQQNNNYDNNILNFNSNEKKHQYETSTTSFQATQIQTPNNSSQIDFNLSNNLTINEQKNNSNPLNVQQLTKSPISCEQAYSQCSLRKACAPALRAYNDNCQDLINNKTDNCSPKCLEAMIALKSNEEGDNLINCDCQDDDYCFQNKLKTKICLPQVEEALKPNTIVSCSTASWICLADQLCLTALDFYYRNCQTLFSQGHCSMRCNNSLAVLYRQPKASKLINCRCDGTEEFQCLKYKSYTERLCLNKPSTQLELDSNNFDNNQQTPSSNLLSKFDLSAAVSTATSEDDSLNMTNDPETFGFTSTGGICGDLNENDEFEDSRIGNGGSEQEEEEEDSSSTTLNGIQSAIDNYIPLISGRYFNQKKSQQHQRNIMKQRNRPYGYYDSKRRNSRISSFFAPYSSSSFSTKLNSELLYLWRFHWFTMIVGYYIVFKFFVL